MPRCDYRDLPNCLVTQIHLEPPRSDSQEQSNKRPPWIRPVRKKASSVNKGNVSDGSSHHSSPESFSPSEYIVDPAVSIASPQSVGQPFSPTSTTGRLASQYLTANRRSSLSLPSFLDTSAAMDMDPSMYMSSPAEVMSMFGDNGVDVASIFPPDFNIGHPAEANDPLYGHLGGAGLVTTP